MLLHGENSLFSFQVRIAREVSAQNVENPVFATWDVAGDSTTPDMPVAVPMVEVDPVHQEPSLTKAVSISNNDEEDEGELW